MKQYTIEDGYISEVYFVITDISQSTWKLQDNCTPVHLSDKKCIGKKQWGAVVILEIFMNIDDDKR